MSHSDNKANTNNNTNSEAPSPFICLGGTFDPTAFLEVFKGHDLTKLDLGSIVVGDYNEPVNAFFDGILAHELPHRPLDCGTYFGMGTSAIGPRIGETKLDERIDWALPDGTAWADFGTRRGRNLDAFAKKD